MSGAPGTRKLFLQAWTILGLGFSIPTLLREREVKATTFVRPDFRFFELLQPLQAGTRENTRRSYQSAVQHFEVTWGDRLHLVSQAWLRNLSTQRVPLLTGTRVCHGR